MLPINFSTIITSHYIPMKTINHNQHIIFQNRHHLKFQYPHNKTLPNSMVWSHTWWGFVYTHTLYTSCINISRCILDKPSPPVVPINGWTDPYKLLQNNPWPVRESRGYKRVSRHGRSTYLDLKKYLDFWGLVLY